MSRTRNGLRWWTRGLGVVDWLYILKNQCSKMSNAQFLIKVFTYYQGGWFRSSANFIFDIIELPSRSYNFQSISSLKEKCLLKPRSSQYFITDLPVISMTIIFFSISFFFQSTSCLHEIVLAIYDPWHNVAYLRTVQYVIYQQEYFWIKITIHVLYQRIANILECH